MSQTTYPSPLEVRAMVASKCAETGLLPVELYLSPRLAWDGEEATLAWRVDLVSREPRPASHCNHKGAIHAGPAGAYFLLGSGDYCLGSLDEAREGLSLRPGIRPSFVFWERAADEKGGA
jgi:hypothetical protein